jgi:hypothetical protein
MATLTRDQLIAIQTAVKVTAETTGVQGFAEQLTEIHELLTDTARIDLFTWEDAEAEYNEEISKGNFNHQVKGL